ncbi:SH3 domain-containing protein [Streptomyces sp. NPDC058420]|uniref:SH3 domain-containing protein n=1 Tax=Streptomyces sp. NPDC058420 TaxID=3346489 RepID=UPI0036611EB3
MISRYRVAAAVAGIALAVGLTGAGTASAAPTTSTPESAAYDSYTIAPYTAVSLRTGPGTGYRWLSTLQFGHTYTAYCWVYGETVVENGYRNNIWIYAFGGTDVGYGYVSAVHLRGDERADLPASAAC